MPLVDIVSKRKRSEMMAGIKGKDTSPELKIRKALHAKGLRYRLHDKSLPGKPDLVFNKYHAAIMIHGCFWHGHECYLFKWPSTRPEFWKSKIGRNRERDMEVRLQLSEAGWRVLTVWECALKGKTKLDINMLLNRIENWIMSEDNNIDIQGH